MDHPEEEITSILSTLPIQKTLPSDIYQYQGYWLDKRTVVGYLITQKHFKASPPTNMVFIASQPKCGTTWLKALVFSIMNRYKFDFATHPLLSSNPHDCVEFLELYACTHPSNPNPTASLVATHLPYTLLPEPIRMNSSSSSSPRIIYIARGPKDAFVSRWHFSRKFLAVRPDLPATAASLEELLDMFCKGLSNSGPFWDHVLEYWKASLEAPDKVMFVKYEDLKKEPHIYVEKMAEFIGLPISEDERKDGVVQKIVDLCSFDNLKNMEVNQGEVVKPNSSRNTFINHIFFRQGQVGDYKNLLNEEMIKRIDEITESKFKGSGLIL